MPASVWGVQESLVWSCDDLETQFPNIRVHFLAAVSGSISSRSLSLSRQHLKFK